MSSVLDREFLTTVEVARRVVRAMGSDKALHPTTVRRWVNRGIQTPNGPIRLTATCLGGRLVVEAPALDRFLRDVAAAKRGGVSNVGTAPEVAD
jgi:hypothetical protein